MVGGAGKRAVIVPEMKAFSRRYGFQFTCHAIDHPNRKAGEERSFWTVESNFLPGRSFDSLEDLNEQARQWATERIEHRAQTKARLIPAKAFEHERGYLNELPPYLPAPYQTHHRGTDQYGYAAFGANYYWVPGSPEILTCLVSDLAASLPNRAGFHVEAEAQVRFVQRRVEGIQRLA